jgi:hypothetical protein
MHLGVLALSAFRKHVLPSGDSHTIDPDRVEGSTGGYIYVSAVPASSAELRVLGGAR